ncbi:MAG: WD40/YVTN/BNR-like repeat-containing protein [Anaerolineae bacterium]
MGRNFSKLVLALVIFATVFLPSTRSGHSMLGGRVAIDFVDAPVYASPDCAVGWWWERDDRTKGLTIYALASHPGSPNVYAGVWGDGVYRAVSGENSWWPTSLGAPIEIASLAIDPSSPTTVYAGTRGNGIYGSINSGDIWGEPALADQEVWSLAITSTADPIYAYAGTAGEIYTSTNGTAWDLAGGTEIGTEKFYVLAVDSQDSKIAYVGTEGKGVYQTTDGGLTWTLSGEELVTMTVRALAIHPGNSDIIYAGTKSHGIFKSTDGGALWPPSGLDGYDVFAIVINPGNPEFIYAGTSGGRVWVSYNGGRSWHTMPGLTGDISYVYSLTLFSPEGEDGCQILYAGTTDGVWARAVTPFYTLCLPLVYKE